MITTIAQTSFGKIAVPIIKISIAAGLLIYIIYKVNFNEIMGALYGADLFYIAGAFILSIFNLFTQFKKWQLSCNKLLHIYSIPKIWRSLFIGFSAGIFTPGRIGEYFGRGIELKEKSILQVSAAVAVDKLFPFLVITFSGAITSIIYLLLVYNLSYFISISLLLLVLFLLVIIITLLLNRKFWEHLLFKQYKIKWFTNLLAGMSNLQLLNRRTTYSLLGLSVLFISIYLLQFVLLLKGFSVNISFANALVGALLVMFVKSVLPTISPGEIGVREGASVLFFTSIGESGAAAFSASIFLFFINVLIPSLIGMFLLIRKHND